MKTKTFVGPKTLRKSCTGIRGLDEITGGGLPTGRLSLICGAAGCGKTLLAMEFLVRGATECDEPGAFLTPSKQSAWCSTPSKVLPLEWRQGEIKQQPLRDNAGAEQAPFVRQTAPRKTGISQQQHGCSHPELP